MVRVLITVAATFALLLLAPSADAFSKYALRLPNGDSVPGSPNVGHVDSAGMGGLNAFGKDWTKLGKGSWSLAYCQADSDGDGFTNGQELGDPCCTWTQEAPGTLITDGISNPGDKSKTPTNPKLQTKCATGGGAAGGGSNGTSADQGPGKVKAGPAKPKDDEKDDVFEAETKKPMPNSATRHSTSAMVAFAAVSSVAVAFLS